MRKIHASLTGIDDDGTEFRLDEPDQLLWVHCAEVDSYVDICRRCGMGATPGQLDAFVDEQRRSAALMGLDPQHVPASVAELDALAQRAHARATLSWRGGVLSNNEMTKLTTPWPAVERMIRGMT